MSELYAIEANYKSGAKMYVGPDTIGAGRMAHDINSASLFGTLKRAYDWLRMYREAFNNAEFGYPTFAVVAYRDTTVSFEPTTDHFEGECPTCGQEHRTKVEPPTRIEQIEAALDEAARRPMLERVLDAARNILSARDDEQLTSQEWDELSAAVDAFGW